MYVWAQAYILLWLDLLQILEAMYKVIGVEVQTEMQDEWFAVLGSHCLYNFPKQSANIYEVLQEKFPGRAGRHVIQALSPRSALPDAGGI